MHILLILAVPVKGQERIWVIGDEFSYTSFHHYYRQNKHEGKPMTYSFTNYEVREFVSTKYSNNNSALSRIHNNLITAVNEYGTTPKAIVFVLDGDIIRGVRETDELTITITIGKITEWLIREVFRVIESYKDYLPEKAKRDNQPHIIWILPPTHKYFTKNNNLKHSIQGNCISTVVKLYKNMTALRMLKIWDPEDGNAVMYDSFKYTASGLTNYWLSVDSAIRFWDVALFPKTGNNPKKRRNNQRDRYKWKKPSQPVINYEDY